MVGHWCFIFPLTLLCRQCAYRLALIDALEEASKQFSVYTPGLSEGKPVTSQSVKKFWWLCGGNVYLVSLLLETLGGLLAWILGQWNAYCLGS